MNFKVIGIDYSNKLIEAEITIEGKTIRVMIPVIDFEVYKEEEA